MDKYDFRAATMFLLSMVLSSVLISVAGCGGGDDSCSDSEEMCDGECVDLQTDVDNCGECGNACETNDNQVASCVDGECEAECEEGFYDCDKKDHTGCESEKACPADGEEEEEEPAADSCSDSEEMCDGECVDLQTDVDNCGECGSACAASDNQVAFCSNGACAVECERGFYDCDNDDDNGCESEEACSVGGEDEEICNNEKDDDGDGDTDCEDSDCDDDDACEETSTAESDCNDDRDNDGDGDTDCEDSDCDGEDGCEYGEEENCDDGEDNDADGDIDCEDSDCNNSDGCEYGEEDTCNDGFDNDADGDTDCADSDCNNSDGCEYGEEDTCNDGFDNDADGDTDCADSDCASDPICEENETDCDDGFDNDGDELIDCLDQDCDLVSGCQFGEELSCDDEFDNDGDGDQDCDDSDCESNPACTERCPDEDLGSNLGDALNSVTSIAAATDDFPVTTCGAEGGVDLSYAWSASAAGCFEVTTQGSNYDTVLRVFATCGGVEQDCDDDGGNGPLSLLRVQAAADDDFVFVVDAKSSAVETESGSAVLNINLVSQECAESTCGDALDNDEDGNTDCADEDCDGIDDCEYEEELTCDDAFDNDADGDIDCLDEDCHLRADCEYENELTCDDGIDNDADGDIDCSDEDCDGVDDCEYDEEVSCGDDYDNDGDGDVDCADTDCNRTPACTGHDCCMAHENPGCNDPTVEACVCGSEIAAGCCGDGSTWTVACVVAVQALNCGSCVGETNCTNGEDDDADGDTDCDDSDCFDNDPTCAERNCNDGNDNDNDGDTDCDDSDCFDALACTEINCDDGDDNDADGDTDCADSDCDLDGVCHNCCEADTDRVGCSNEVVQECVCEGDLSSGCCEAETGWGVLCPLAAMACGAVCI